MYHWNKDISESSFLVTGGAGFIGSHLVEYLLKHGAKKVRVLDNFSTGFHKNLEGFSTYPAFELVEGDIRDCHACKFATKGVQFVFHEAALGSVPRSIVDPITSNEVNVNGFLNILIAARDFNVKRIIYAASSSTYGDSAELPKVEERIGRPLSPYAVTKLVDELYADVFAKTYGMEMIGLRYFNVFGPRQNPEGAYAAVIPRFVESLLSHRAPVINGDGEYSRDFTYIENVIQMNIKAALMESSAVVNQVYNVAFGQQTSLNKLVIYLKKCLSDLDPSVSEIPVQYGSARVGDIPHSLASIQKARQLLDYDPKYNIEEGLVETVKWYARERLHTI